MSENKNQLMEAAAEVLAQSKAKAPAEPMPKVDTSSVGGMQDLGGPTPSNNKPDDDSNKINASGAAPDNSAKNQASIKTKPSAASAKNEEAETEDEVIEEKKGMPQGLKDYLAKKKDKMKEEVSEDVNSLFSEDENISEDFKKKASIVYEARVNDRVTQIVEEVEGQYATMFEEAVTEIKTELTEKVDDYLNYVVEQWMTDNQIAVESGLRAELTEEFISGLRNLFAEHYIDVPEEKVDLVDELATRVEALESQLDEEMERGMEFAKALVTARQNEITSEVCEGLTDTQEEKIKTLAEGVDFSTEEEFREKVKTIRENYFPSEVKQADEETLNEKVETDADKKVVSNDPFVNAVSKAISQTKN